MKILWVCSMAIPLIHRLLGRTSNNCFGGWLDGLSSHLLQCPEVELVFCYPEYGASAPVIGSGERFRFYGIPSTEAFVYHGEPEAVPAVECFTQVLKNEQPDVIHFFGTECAYHPCYIDVCGRNGYGSRVVTSIQGMLAVYALHFDGGMPYRAFRRRTLQDWKHGRSLPKTQKKMERLGIFEKQALRHSRYIIGRTSWDLACATLFAPEARYRHCDETLRAPFYAGQWSAAECTPCQIVASQGTVPYKGLHQLVLAVAQLAAEYPALTVKVAGPDLFHGDWIHGYTYGVYIRDLLREHRLTERFSFVGMQNAEEMKALMLSSNVFVSPSAIENSPNALGEAMLLGLPCIASDVGGVADMMERNREGFLYPFNETYKLAYYLKRVLDGGAEIEAMARAARQRALVTHDPEGNNARLMEIYREIVTAAE